MMKKILLITIIAIMSIGSANAWTPKYHRPYERHKVKTVKKVKHVHKKNKKKKIVKTKVVKHHYHDTRYHPHYRRHHPKIIVKETHYVRPRHDVVVVEKHHTHGGYHNHGNMFGAFLLGFLFGNVS